MKSFAICAMVFSVSMQMSAHAQIEIQAIGATTKDVLTKSASDFTSSVSFASSDGNAAPLDLKFKFPASSNLFFDVSAEVNAASVPGTALLKWKNDELSYELSLDIIANNTQSSQGSQSKHGLEPSVYRRKSLQRAEQVTHFRREIGKIQFSRKPDAVLMSGAQDYLSAMFQLVGMVSGRPNGFKVGDQVQMQVAGVQNATIWKFTFEEVSEIIVADEPVKALKFNRSASDLQGLGLQIWLASKLGYLPIRIRQSSQNADRENFIDFVLRKLP